MAHISLHMINVHQISDVYGIKTYWYVDDGFGNLTPVTTIAKEAAEYSLRTAYGMEN